MHLQPSSPDDLSALSTFLQRMFRVPRTSAFLDERHVAWKYWSARGDWSGARSFTARHGGTTVAHVAAWPIRVALGDRILQGAHLIDWASDPAYPGAGMWLLRYVRAKAPLLIATGGTAATERTLPALGFRSVGTIDCYARPLRPWGQAVTAKRDPLRSPARFVRNTMWRLFPSLLVPAGWSADAVGPDEIDEPAWPAASGNTGVTVRDAAFYRYVLSSPVTRHVLHGLRRHGTLVGFFCLAYARHVARIADFWVASSSVDDWCAGVRVAAATAARANDVHEVTAWASTALSRTALTRAGFRLRDRSALSASGDLAPIGPGELHVQMIDCDASFLRADEICYLT